MGRKNKKTKTRDGNPSNTATAPLETTALVEQAPGISLAEIRGQLSVIEIMTTEEGCDKSLVQALLASIETQLRQLTHEKLDTATRQEYQALLTKLGELNRKNPSQKSAPKPHKSYSHVAAPADSRDNSQPTRPTTTATHREHHNPHFASAATAAPSSTDWQPNLNEEQLMKLAIAESLQPKKPPSKATGSHWFLKTGDFPPLPSSQRADNPKQDFFKPKPPEPKPPTGATAAAARLPPKKVFNHKAG